MKDSNIEWTHNTFNPWWGCTKVSRGCKNCYAETLATRYKHECWGPKGLRKPMSEDYWKQPLKWNREAERESVRKRVFCASMADVFEGRETMPEESWSMVCQARHRLFDLIEKTPWLDWLLLTKRPENIKQMMGARWFLDELPSNVWLGTSVEDQATADERIPHLLRIPAKVRFLSCEPLLGDTDLTPWLWQCRMGCTDGDCCPGDCINPRSPIHWVICGGESGRDARPMHPDWVRSLRDQCVEAQVPFFFKQWGEWVPIRREDVDGEPVMGKVGKKAAGRLLDGRDWNEFPVVEPWR